MAPAEKLPTHQLSRLNIRGSLQQMRSKDWAHFVESVRVEIPLAHFQSWDYQNSLLTKMMPMCLNFFGVGGGGGGKNANLQARLSHV